MVLRSLGEAGSGGRWCAKRLFVIVRKAPRPVGAQIRDENLVAHGNGYDLVWM